MRTVVPLSLLATLLASCSAPEFAAPPSGAGLADAALGPDTLGLVINEADSLSVQIGEYYQRRRSVPDSNVARVRFSPSATLVAGDFDRIKREVDSALPPRVQALALAWAEPFRVGCMSITSAFAFGFDEKRCAAGCLPTPLSPYYDSESRAPYYDFGMRPTMSIAATTFEEARALIDRGIGADGTDPSGAAYLLETSDDARNARAGSYPQARWLESESLAVDVVHADSIEDRSDVLFYFTGVTRVGDLDSNHFIPGAMADHLTSSGGVLNGVAQMSSLRWLEAGATASYGTVVEPCAIPGKFPSPPIAMKRYLDGETLIEAYWKSVAMPAQGLFIGEPLARPFAARRSRTGGAS